MLNLIAVLIFMAVCLGLVALFRPVRPDLRALLAGDQPSSPEPTVRPGLGDRFERRALQAGLGWTRRHWLAAAAVGVALGIALWAVGLTATGTGLALVGLWGPWLYASHLRIRRQERFAAQLPPALFLAASVLRAGGTLMQAVEAIAAQMDEPLGGEFRRILAQMRLQVPAHQAMAAAMARVGVRDFAAVVVAARIAAEVGGDLAHVFAEIGRAVVDGQNAQRSLRAATTEGRLSADLIAALPFVVMGLLHWLSPGYFGGLLATWPGRILAALCLGAIFLGWRIVRRMVDIRLE